MKYNKKDFTLVPSRTARIGMPANQQVVYMWLCEHSDDNNQSFPSRKVLAYECGMSASTLDRTIIELEKQGFISRETRYAENKQRSNLYTVFIVTKGIQYDDTPLVNMTTPPIHIDEQNPTHITQPIKNPISKSKDLLVNSALPHSPARNFKTLFMEIVIALGFTDKVMCTAGRLKKLKSRNKTFKYDELIQAAKALGADAYMQGENEQGKRWGTIDYFLRSDEIVAKYLELNEGSELAIGGPIDESKYV